MRGKLQGLRSANQQVQNRQGDVKNSIGNGVAKELICMTHGHELRRDCRMEWGFEVEGAKGENWDNCNNIVNKTYFLKS